MSQNNRKYRQIIDEFCDRISVTSVVQSVDKWSACNRIVSSLLSLFFGPKIWWSSRSMHWKGCSRFFEVFLFPCRYEITHLIKTTIGQQFTKRIVSTCIHYNASDHFVCEILIHWLLYSGLSTFSVFLSSSSFSIYRYLYLSLFLGTWWLSKWFSFQIWFFFFEIEYWIWQMGCLCVNVIHQIS